MDSQPTDKVEGVGDDFVRGGQDETPIKPRSNSRQRIVVSAGTPTVTVTAGNEQFYAPWIVESPGGTVTISAYNDGKKRCLSAEGGSGDPRKKALEQNKTFMRAHRKSGGLDLTEEEIRAEAHKREKEMGDAARAAETAKEEVALEKRKGLAEKEAARKAATGQAGTVKRAAEEAARWAASGQAGKDNSWTKQLEALLPTPWKTSTPRNLGLVQGPCATAAQKKSNAAPGKSQMSTPTTAKTKTRRKAKFIRTIAAAAKTRAPWITQRWKLTSTEMAMPGITNA
jgi:hypothetical protein